MNHSLSILQALFLSYLLITPFIHDPNKTLGGSTSNEAQMPEVMPLHPFEGVKLISTTNTIPEGTDRMLLVQIAHRGHSSSDSVKFGETKLIPLDLHNHNKIIKPYPPQPQPDSAIYELWYLLLGTGGPLSENIHVFGADTSYLLGYSAYEFVDQNKPISKEGGSTSQITFQSPDAWANVYPGDLFYGAGLYFSNGTFSPLTESEELFEQHLPNNITNHAFLRYRFLYVTGKANFSSNGFSYFNYGTTQGFVIHYSKKSFRPFKFFVSPFGFSNNLAYDWAHSSRDLLHILEVARPGDTIFATEGAYFLGEVISGSFNSFHLKDSVVVLGGFPYGGSDLTGRDPQCYVSTIDGSHSHVAVVARNVSEQCVLDGFVIAGGHATRIDPEGNFFSQGAGLSIYSTNSAKGPIIRNSVFRENTAIEGGAISITDQDSTLLSPQFINCLFNKNSARAGGAILIDATKGLIYPVFVNSIFTQNQADSGGVITVKGNTALVEQVSFINCLFDKNKATTGSLFFESVPSASTKVSWINSILLDNEEEAIFNSKASVTIKNTYLYNPLSADYTDAGGNTIGGDPEISLVESYYFVNNGSLLIDAGSMHDVPLNLDQDFNLNPRILGSSIDIGPFEIEKLQCRSEQNNVLYVDMNATGNQDGSSWINAFKNLSKALYYAEKCPFIDSILIAQGVYVPEFIVDLSDPCGRTLPAYYRLNVQFKIRDGLTLVGGYPTGGGMRELSCYPSTLAARQFNLTENGIPDYYLITIENARRGIHLDGLTLSGGYNSSNNGILRGGAVLQAARNDSSFLSLSHCLIQSSFTDDFLIKNQSAGGVSKLQIDNSILLNDVFSSGFISNRGAIDSAQVYSINNLYHSLYNNTRMSNLDGGRFININDIHSGVYDPSSMVSSIGNCGFGNCLFTSDFPVNASDLGHNLVQSNPLYYNEGGLNFRVYNESPAINRGLDTLLTATLDYDLKKRIQGGRIDIGPFEKTVLNTTIECENYINVRILYVDSSANGANNGLSWQHSFTRLQDALKVAWECGQIDTIKLAAGTYIPDPGFEEFVLPCGVYEIFRRDQNNTGFNFPDSLKLVGGYPHGGGDRNYYCNKSIISGNTGVKEHPYDNIPTLLTASGIKSGLIDGITFSDAYSNDFNKGGALFSRNSNLKIRNCVFRNNISFTGAAIRQNTDSSSGSLIVLNSEFFKNHAQTYGGAVFSSSGYSMKMDFVHCTFNNNYGNGTALYHQAFQDSSIAHFTNCIINNNQLYAVINEGGSITYSSTNISNGYVGNLDPVIFEDPLWYDEFNGLHFLKSTSPAINQAVALTSEYQEEIPYDLKYENRQGIWDIGAYEFAVLADTVPTLNPNEYGQTIYVDAEGQGLQTGKSWNEALTNLETALQLKKLFPQIDTIKVAQGNYFPGKIDSFQDLCGNLQQSKITRGEHFEIPDSLILIGGYKTGGGERNFYCYQSILSGLLHTEGHTHNFRSILVYDDVNSSQLDGFHIQNSYGNDLPGSSALVIRNSSLVIRNCYFRNNSSTEGAAISITTDQITKPINIINCEFLNNQASLGACIKLVNREITTLNIYACTFTNNQGPSNLAFIQSENQPANVYFLGCILNGTDNAQGLTAINANVYLRGCIYKNLGENWINQGLNSLQNPDFFNPEYSVYFLRKTSPAVNLLKDSLPLAISELRFDLKYEPRISKGFMDAGAYEFNFDQLSEIQIDCNLYTTLGTLYVDQSATGLNTGKTWIDAFTDLSAALLVARTCGTIDTIKVAQGLYYPASPDTVTDACGIDFISPPSSTQSFDFPDSLVVLGAYPPGGGARNLACFKPELSGQYRAYHVISTRNLKKFKLDGFIVSEGSNQYITDEEHQYGNAWYHSSDLDSSFIEIDHCIFRYHQANYGLIYNRSLKGRSIIRITNSLISQNNASPILAVDNQGVEASFQIINSTLSFGYYPLIGSLGSTNKNKSMVLNSVISNQNFLGGDSLVTIAYSLIGQNSMDFEDKGNNLYGQNPLFIDNGNNFHVKPLSPLIDNGINLLGGEIDLDGNPRPANGRYDIGAYETHRDLLLDTTRILGGQIFVDSSAHGNNDGSSWSNAFTRLQYAIALAQQMNSISDIKIKIAQGTYFNDYEQVILDPCTGNHQTEPASRISVFTFPKNVRGIYGGFPSGGGANSDPACFKSILSGNLGDKSVDYDNSFHILKLDVQSGFILSGLQISDGNAFSDFYSGNGSVGGGLIVNTASDSGVLKIEDCQFINNSAYFGGGIYYEFFDKNKLDFRIERSQFINNQSTQGGAVYYNISNCRQFEGWIANSLFIANQANQGSALFSQISGSNPVISNLSFFNNTFRDNRSPGLGEVLYSGTYNGNQLSVSMVNNILVTNTTVPIYTDNWPSMILSGKNNLFNGGLQENMLDLGGNLINTDPLLDQMHRPLPGSPLINTGANTITSVSDLDRMPRVIDKHADLGAYEFPTGKKDTLQLYFVQGSSIRFNSENFKKTYWNNTGSLVPYIGDQILDLEFKPKETGVFCYTIDFKKKECPAETIYSIPWCVQINMLIRPDIICPRDTTIYLAPFACEVPFSYQITPVEEDVVDSLSLLKGQYSGTSFKPGKSIITWVAHGQGGLKDTCSFAVHVVEYNPGGKTLLCNKAVSKVIDECNLNLAPLEVLIGSYGCIEKFSVTFSFPFGKKRFTDGTLSGQIYFGPPVIYKVLDKSNGAACWGYVLTEDQSLTELAAPDTISCFEVNDLPQGTYSHSEPCGGKTKISVISEQYTIEDCFLRDIIGKVNRNLSVTDKWGNTRLVNKEYFIQKAHLDSILCPSDTIMTKTSKDTVDISGQVISYLSPLNSGIPKLKAGLKRLSLWPLDAVCNFETIYWDQKTDEAEDGSYNILRTWYITDKCVGFGITCHQLIQVKLPVQDLRLDNKSNAREKRKDHQLLQNYPNPFNVSTTIELFLNNPGNGRLRIIDLAGRTVKSIEKNWERGHHKILIHKNELGDNGIYYYRFESKYFNAVQKMVILQ